MAPVPEQVVTDGLSSYPRAIQEELGEDVEHEVRGCLGNPIPDDIDSISCLHQPLMDGFSNSQVIFHNEDAHQ